MNRDFASEFEEFKDNKSIHVVFRDSRDPIAMEIPYLKLKYSIGTFFISFYGSIVVSIILVLIGVIIWFVFRFFSNFFKK
jgi:hypothetical protein